MQNGRIKIGTLARKTGLTVRTLHYYEEIGLLSPAARTDAGHRLYGPEDVRRLQQIVSLRALGLPLDEIGACLDAPDCSLPHVIDLHLAHLRAEIDQRQQLCRRLEALAEQLRTNGQAVTVETLTNTIEAIVMYENYYTPEQLATLKQRAETLGEDRIQQAQADWQALITEVRAEMEQGTDPRSQRMQALAARWQALIEAFTGGDPAIRESLQKMYTAEGTDKASHGMVDPEVMGYVAKAMQDV